MRITNSYLPAVARPAKRQKKPSTGSFGRRLASFTPPRSQARDDFIDAEFEELLDAEESDTPYGEGGYKAIKSPKFMYKKIYVDYYV